MGLKPCIVIVISALLWIPSAFAEIRITQITGISFIEGKIINNTDSVTRIYGGFAGSDSAGTCATKDNVNPCSSCDGTLPCNATRAYANLKIRISFTSTTAHGLPQIAQDEVTNALIPNAGRSNGIGNNAAANTPVWIDVTWGDLCNAIGSDATCSTELNGARFRVGIDGVDPNINGNPDENLGADSFDDFTTEISVYTSPNPTGGASVALCTSAGAAPSGGVCNFVAYPGDQKVFIEDARAAGGVSAGSIAATSLRALRIYYGETDFASVTSGSPSEDLVISGSDNGDGKTNALSFTNNEVTGLENGKNYFFKSATVDRAGNVSYLLDNPSSVNINTNTQCYTPDADYPFNCHMAQPTEITGLLGDEMDCFITTATYGSPFSPQVKTFREFRNRFLKTHAIGRKIIGFYYQHSPPLANWLKDHPEFKPVARAILFPLWAVAKALITFGYWCFIFLSLLLILPFFSKSWRYS